MAACCRSLWLWYVSCSAVLVTAVRCMCAAVAWASSAWVRSRVQTAVGTSPLRTASSPSVCFRFQFLGCRGPCQPPGGLCDGVGWVQVCEGVESPVQRARLEMVPGFFFSVATDACGVPCRDVDVAACVPSVVSGEEEKLLEGELESGFL